LEKFLTVFLTFSDKYFEMAVVGYLYPFTFFAGLSDSGESIIFRYLKGPLVRFLGEATIYP
jgi:hypothetical protein